jgi:hypothetical protein
MGKIKHVIKLSFALLAVMILTQSGNTWAQFLSPNYRIEETYFGTGGELDASSTNYRARQSAGSLGVGDAASTNFRANGGFNTQSEPFLEMNIEAATVNLGILDPNTTSYGAAQAGTCNCSFSVRSYLSSEYVIVTASQPPTNESGDSLDAKTTLGVPSSNPSVEEFGINLVDNATPNIGANPSNQPDNSFADGRAASGYDTPDQFKYAVGDIIARSPLTSGNQGIGKTNYTISYIAKISNLTPAGNYIMKHDIIAVPAF